MDRVDLTRKSHIAFLIHRKQRYYALLSMLIQFYQLKAIVPCIATMLYIAATFFLIRLSKLYIHSIQVA